MPASFAELDCQQTDLGELTLRRRASPSLGGAMVYEVRLNNEFLMSSIVTDSEVALSDLAIELFGDGPCSVLVGGLGLGYTAATALRHEQVQHVRVIERLAPVIGWHRDQLVPAARQLMEDPRCTIVEGDVFEHLAGDPSAADARYDLILLDVDHTPDAWLHGSHRRFYTADSLARMQRHMSPRGVFGLWSAEPVGEPFLQQLGEVFDDVRQHPIRYTHPLLHVEEENAIILATAPRCAGS